MSKQKTFANNDEKKSLEITFVNADYMKEYRNICGYVSYFNKYKIYLAILRKKVQKCHANCVYII